MILIEQKYLSMLSPRITLKNLAAHPTTPDTAEQLDVDVIDVDITAVLVTIFTFMIVLKSKIITYSQCTFIPFHSLLSRLLFFYIVLMGRTRLNAVRRRRLEELVNRIIAIVVPAANSAVCRGGTIIWSLTLPYDLFDIREEMLRVSMGGSANFPPLVRLRSPPRNGFRHIPLIQVPLHQPSLREYLINGSFGAARLTVNRAPTATVAPIATSLVLLPVTAALHTFLASGSTPSQQPLAARTTNAHVVRNAVPSGTSTTTTTSAATTTLLSADDKHFSYNPTWRRSALKTLKT